MPTALITGVTGQDGSYLAQHLLAKGYHVIGLSRRSIDVATSVMGELSAGVDVRTVDLQDPRQLGAAVKDAAPDEIYHLASQSVVHASWKNPVQTAELTAVGALRVLEAARAESPAARILMASSSEVFGRPAEYPQSESTPMLPRSPYGAAKLFALHMTAIYREAHSLYAASAILYNHESPRRGPEFVTRKITDGVARIAAGQTAALRLGNLEAQRDWGFAGDYVDAMWRMLQQPTPSDFVVGTGISHSVRDFCEAAFRVAGLDYLDHVVQDEQFFRPLDSGTLLADPRRAKGVLGWEPQVSFEAMVEMMVNADVRRLKDAELL
ncbi:MAG: GDP-mannose 4,6-dehydratase [Gemmatimonadaceae bacterium]|nr:GDP-mannose 4,6-dehydratase [Gemmatimonadaceae bacterium]